MATESDNVNSGALGTLVAVGTFAMLGISLVVTALVRTEMQQESEKKDVAADRPYRDLVAEQTAKQNAPASYSDRNKGLVGLPLTRAMELTVLDLAKDPNSATPPPPKEEKDAGAELADAGSGGAPPAAEDAPAPVAPAPVAPAPKPAPVAPAPKPAPVAPAPVAPAPKPAPIAPAPVAPAPPNAP